MRDLTASVGLRFCRLALGAPPETFVWQDAIPGDPLWEAEAHLWFLDLDRSLAPLESFWDLLDADERARAQRFRFAIDRRRFVIRRGSLRQLLGRYRERPPADIEFAYNAYGKPSLKPGADSGGIQFSVSASAELALWGFTRERPIGIDLEKVQPAFAWEEIARSAFHPAEIQHIRQQPPEAQRYCFLRHWTTREAFVKARGVGLAQALKQLDFSPLFRADRRHGIESCGGRWDCISFQPNTDSVASLVWQR